MQGAAGQADKAKDKLKDVAMTAGKKLRRSKDKPCRVHIKVRPTFAPPLLLWRCSRDNLADSRIGFQRRLRFLCICTCRQDRPI